MADSGIDAIFSAKRIAILGASSDPSKFGYRAVINLQESGFTGEIIPVSRSGGEVLGLPAIPDLAAAPPGIDLVLMCIPAGAVPDAISQAISLDAKAAVVYAAGFAEAGEKGRALQDDLCTRLKAGRLRMVGPNCLGVRHFHTGVNATVNRADAPKAGPIAFLSQSGSFGNACFSALGHLRVGLSIYASIGNIIDVTHADLIRYCGDDPHTEVVCAFAEGVPNIDALLDAIAEVAPKKPIVVLKGGRSPFGQRAALSHTSSLGADGRVMAALLREAGAIVVESMQELFDTSAAFAMSGKHLPRGRRTSIFAVSGGPSVVASDHCYDEKLDLPPLGERLKDLRKILPPWAAINNPVEIGGQAKGAYVTSATSIAAQDVVDSMIAIAIGLDIPDFGAGVVEARAAKPVVSCVVAPKMEDLFEATGIPNYPSVERAVRAMRHLTDRGTIPPLPNRPRGKALAPHDLRDGVLSEAESKKYLAHYGLPITPEEEVTGVDAALAAAERIGYPVALKVSSAEIAHKSDRGGVLLGLADPQALRAACALMQQRFPDTPVLVQKMLPPGIELIIGASRTDATGPVVMIGVGGVLTEVLNDVVFCRAPAAPEAVRAALAQLRTHQLLDGYRGMPAVDKHAVAQIAATLSGIVAANPRITEVDLNPVIATASGAVIADALIRVG
jgi:acetyltransferase